MDYKESWEYMKKYLNDFIEIHELLLSSSNESERLIREGRISGLKGVLVKMTEQED